MSFCFTVSLFGSIYLGYWLFYVILFLVFVLVYVLACGLGIVGQFLLGGRKIQQIQKGVPQDVKLTIDNETIMFDNNSGQSIFKWNSVKDVYNKKYSLLIFIADVQAIIIPKRIFSSEEEIDNCWKYLQDCYNNAQNKT